MSNGLAGLGSRRLGYALSVLHLSVPLCLLWMVINAEVVPAVASRTGLRSREQTFRRHPTQLSPNATAGASGVVAEPTTNSSPANRTTMYITTAINSEPCDTALGTYINLLGIKNKEDYSRFHGYGFYYAIDYVDPLLRGPWNKIKVLQMLQNRFDRSEAEWLMWVDNDALFLDVNVVPLFEDYHGKDVVFWGFEKELYQDADALHGLNGGVLLFRNSDWTRNFLAELADYGLNWFTNGSRFETDMKASLKNYNWNLFEQNAFAHILKVKPAYRSKVFLEYWAHSPFHVFYRHVPVAEGDNLTASHVAKGDKTAYIVHFAGCQYCASKYSSGNMTDCYLDFVKVFGFAYNKLQSVLGEMRDFHTDWLVSYVQDRMSGGARS